MSGPLAGVFVGGAATRMGGAPKGLLRLPGGETLVQRWRALLEAEGARVVLVGAGDAYRSLGLEILEDDPPGIGPIGGLVSLLHRAEGGVGIAVACDMPFVTSALLGRLLAAAPAPVVAPRREGRWEPLFARYDSARVLPLARAHVAGGRRALHDLLYASGAVELPLTVDEAAQLRDWDSPADVTGS
jgi:molybdopterin-guanine dinucleotide biosynthesis protein A